MTHTRNTDLFNAIADEIEKDPDAYDQDVFGRRAESACGSAFCIAGWAVAKTYGLDCLFSDDGEFKLWYGSGGPDNFNGKHIENHAGELLGLDYHEGDRLFAPEWRPAEGWTAPEALRMIGKGGDLAEYSYNCDHCDGDCDCE